MEQIQLERLQEMEDIIKEIKNIISAKVVTGKDGTIEEIHVLAGPSRSPKQIVRDIESAMMAQFSLNIDHKKISVAQMQDEEVQLVEVNVRPRLDSLTTTTAGMNAIAKVVLQIGDEVYEGEDSGPASTANRLRLVCRATLQAVEDYLRGSLTLMIEDLHIFNISTKQAVVVGISLVHAAGEEHLLGVAYVKRDEGEAVVKATLCAVNRRLALLAKE